MTAVTTENKVSAQELLLGKALEYERYEGHKPLAFVHSYGCQQNVSDGEKLKGMLLNIAFGFTDKPDDAALIIYNTCAVRENAEDRVFGNLGQLKKLKE
jgi:tRNA-2-methylthio-N6-dimethylallyladenosine synthase